MPGVRVRHGANDILVIGRLDVVAGIDDQKLAGLPVSIDEAPEQRAITFELVIFPVQPLRAFPGVDLVGVRIPDPHVHVCGGRIFFEPALLHFHEIQIGRAHV